MYLIIVGAGDIGTPLIEIATQGGNEVVVVEKDAEKAERIATSYDCVVVNGDATVKDTLQDAGGEKADAIISTTEKDASNVMVSLLAKELEIPSVVSVVHDPEHMGIFERVGVHTMENPSRLLAEHLYRGVSSPQIEDYIKLSGDAEVFGITVDEGAPVEGLTLTEAADEGLITDKMVIVAIERDMNGKPDVITPWGGTRIEAEDLLTVFSEEGLKDGVIDVFST
ncbi:MAG: TrkA family potassium uptake protein [Halobacteria archaeon]